MAMAHVQRLKLTLRNVASDRTWTGQPLTISADPDDTEAIRENAEQMARDLDHRTGDPWWLKQYTLHVQGIDQEWRDFWISAAGN